MFALIYNNEYLDLEPGQNPVIEWVSTLFNESDDLLGSFSYSIELANTSKNNLLLGNGNQLASRFARQDVEVMVELLGMPWKRCTLTYDISNGKRRGNLKIDNGEFASIIKDVKLPQVFEKLNNGSFVEFEYITLGTTLQQTYDNVTLSAKTVGAYPYAFYPFENKKIFGDYSGDDDDRQYLDTVYLNEWVNQNGGGFLNNGVTKKYWFCPSMYLSCVV